MTVWRGKEKYGYVVCAACASDGCPHVDGEVDGLQRYRVDVELVRAYYFSVLAHSAREAEEAAEEAFGSLVLREEPDDEDVFYHVEPMDG